MAEQLTADCASDPPLGATARALAVARADQLLLGLGGMALAQPRARLQIRVRHDDAREAVAAAIVRRAANVAVIQLADAWPPPPARGLLDAAALVQADERRRGATTQFVTVAGAVAAPAVLATAPATVEALVAQAGGALDDDWVAVAGGAPAGRLVERAATLAQAGEPTLLLILPAGHEVIRRLRTPLSDWLWRAASACEGCRVCSDVCAASASPHTLLAALATLRDERLDSDGALRCSGCGLCDAVCPSGLSPRALTVDVRDRLHAAGAIATPPTGPRSDELDARPGLDVALLTLRLGLQPYDRAPTLRL